MRSINDSEGVHASTSLEIPDLIIPKRAETIWADPVLKDQEDWFTAAIYYFSHYQKQQPSYRDKRKLGDDDERFLDRLALFFARETDPTETRKHVTATGIIKSFEEAKSGALVVCIAKNNGPDTKDKACLRWLNEWFAQMEPGNHSDQVDKTNWPKLLDFWKERIKKYKTRVPDAWSKCSSHETEIGKYVQREYLRGNQMAFRKEWAAVKELVDLAQRPTSAPEDDGQWGRYHKVWHEMKNREKSNDMSNAVKAYHDCLYYLGMLAMHMSIWKSMHAFRNHHDRKTVQFVFLPKPKLDNAARWLQKKTVEKTLNSWNDDGAISENEKIEISKALTWLRQGASKQEKYLHCEMQLLMLFNQLDETLEAGEFIGCSKLSCHLCWQLLKGHKFETRGCHGKIYPNWAFPFPKASVQTRDQFVQMREEWEAKLKKHPDGNHTRFSMSRDTIPPDTMKEIEKALEENGVKGYPRNAFPYTIIKEGMKKGGFSKVYRAMRSDSAQLYAVKEVIVYDDSILDITKTEIKVLRTCRASDGPGKQHVVSLEDLFHDRDQPALIYLVLSPCAPQSLEDVFRHYMSGDQTSTSSSFSSSVALGLQVSTTDERIGEWPSVVHQCLSGLLFLHTANIKHKDIKPANIVLEGTPNGSVRAVFIDFNVSRQNYRSGMATNYAGTYVFMAPEQFDSEPEGTSRSDVWSLGCCFALILVLLQAGPETLARVWQKVVESQSGFHKEENLNWIQETLATGEATQEVINGNERGSYSAAATSREAIVKTVFLSRLQKLVFRSMLEGRDGHHQKRATTTEALHFAKELELRLSFLRLRLRPLHFFIQYDSRFVVHEIGPLDLLPCKQLTSWLVDLYSWYTYCHEYKYTHPDLPPDTLPAVRPQDRTGVRLVQVTLRKRDANARLLMTPFSTCEDRSNTTLTMRDYAHRDVRVHILDLDSFQRHWTEADSWVDAAPLYQFLCSDSEDEEAAIGFMLGDPPGTDQVGVLVGMVMAIMFYVVLISLSSLVFSPNNAGFLET